MKNIVLCCLVGAAQLVGQAGFGAGAAKRIITPDPLLPVSGGMGTPRAVTSKRGELTARALVVRNGSETVAIVSVDLIGFPSVLGDRVRAMVPRLAPERILIGATHTHSAPDSYAFPDGKGGHTASLDYLKFVVEQAAGAVNDALDAMKPAELRVATGEVKGKVAYNYYAPDLYDRRASVVQVRGESGGIIATLVNYAIHPEVLGNDVGILSPDLVGPLTDRLEKEGGIGIFMNGAQGGMITADNRNLNEGPRDSARAYWRDSRTWEECERIGGLLANEALRIVGPVAWQKSPVVRNQQAEVRFPVESKEMWQVVEGSPLNYPRRDSDRSVVTRINLVTLGNAQILTIPGEALPNIGFYLKRKMRGEHNLLFGLTNDGFGYILTKVDFASFPRYEYISRVSLGEMTGEILIEKAL
jgi:hypothetical protein